MKTKNSRMIAWGASCAACICIGAVVDPFVRAESDGADATVETLRSEALAARPGGVSEQNWIPIGDRAGYAVTREVSHAVIEAALYLKTEKGWCRVQIENPLTPQLLGR